jgi:SAM-dependent methyltransferase
MSDSTKGATVESGSNPYDESYFKTGPYARVSFARFSQYWWSNRFYARLARRHGPKRGTVLEVGCGLGHLLGWLCRDYAVYGTDINAWALSQARRVVPQGHFALASAENLGAFPPASFQIVIAKHVVEHLSRPELAIAGMSRLLSPGGLLLLATPNLASPMRGVKKEHWIGYKDPTHISLRPPAEWLALLEVHGLRPQRVFSDGFWDAPYLPVLPAALQKLVFGAPGGLQAILGWSIIPLRMGESLIVLADKV